MVLRPVSTTMTMLLLLLLLLLLLNLWKKMNLRMRGSQEHTQRSAPDSSKRQIPSRHCHSHASTIAR